MTNDFRIVEATSFQSETLEQLSELLIAVVEDGASIGFLPPLSKENAMDYWRGVTQPGVIVWIVRDDNKICGTVQLHLAQRQNAAHRAETAKLMVHPGKRNQGIARALMTTVESRAKKEGRSLLVLDTRAGDPSNRLYKSIGYTEAGRIPGYAMSADGSLDETVIYYKQI